MPDYIRRRERPWFRKAAALLKRDDRDDVDNFRRQGDAARERNLTHLVVLTMGQGRSPEEHIDAVRTAGEAMR